jgi:SAM-dependent methyltransferase
MAGQTTKNAAADKRRRERISGLARRVGAVFGGRVEQRIERRLLRHAWRHRKPGSLARYLVSGYQNPVINVQSILARHELVREVDGATHDDLMADELSWAVGMNRELGKRQHDLSLELGLRLSEIKRTRQWKAVYDEVVVDPDRFATLWTAALSAGPHGRLSVIEVACGSANDYRYLDIYGMAPLLDYTGFDLTQKNIANARQMFPEVDFRIGDVQDIEADDGSYDWAVVHDLLEHLSPAAYERAVDELCRVSRRGVLISFFRMQDTPEHQVKQKGSYHFNQLSKEGVAERFARHCSDITWVHVRPMLAARYDFGDYYNQRAWTMIARH